MPSKPYDGKIEYTLREDIFQKMARREKSLQARPVKWLREKCNAKKMVQVGDWRKVGKSQCICLILSNEYGYRYWVAYTNVKMERSAPKHP